MYDRIHLQLHHWRATSRYMHQAQTRHQYNDVVLPQSFSSLHLSTTAIIHSKAAQATAGTPCSAARPPSHATARTAGKCHNISLCISRLRRSLRPAALRVHRSSSRAPQAAATRECCTARSASGRAATADATHCPLVSSARDPPHLALRPCSCPRDLPLPVTPAPMSTPSSKCAWPAGAASRSARRRRGCPPEGRWRPTACHKYICVRLFACV